MSAGAQERDRLLAAGFEPEEVAEWEMGQRATLGAAGFSPDEVDEHFGRTAPDMRAVKAQMVANLGARQPADDVPKMSAEPAGFKGQKATGGLKSLRADPADDSYSASSVVGGLVDDFLAGTQISVSGLVKRGKLPDTVVPEHASMAEKLAASAGTFVGDIPYMVAGSKAGALVGAPAGAVAGGAAAALGMGVGIPVGGILGGTIGGTAGAFALPGFLRKALMDQYEKGSITSWEDFYARTYAAFKEGLKHGTIGAATGAAGTYAKISLAGMTSLTRNTAATGAEIAAMTFLGKAIEDQVPNAGDLAENALFVVGLHGVTRAFQHAPQVERSLRRVFAKSGRWGEPVLQEIERNPAAREDAIAVNGRLEDRFEAPAGEVPAQERTRQQVEKEFDDTVDLYNAEQDPAKRAQLEKQMDALVLEGEALDAAAAAQPAPAPAPAPAAPPAKPAPVQMVDTRGKGEIFHGTSREIGALKEGSYASLNYYGQGFYTTEAVDIARGYTKKGKGGQPTIYRVSEKQPVKLFDMEAPLDEAATAIVRKVAESPYGEAAPIVAQALEDKPANMRELFDGIREYSASEGVSADEVQVVWDEVRANLEQQGYRGYSHAGGKLTNKPEHQVKIYWFPETDVAIEKVDPKAYEQPSTVVDPATGQILEEFDKSGASSYKAAPEFGMLTTDGAPAPAQAPAAEPAPSAIDAARADHLWDQVKAGKTTAFGHKSAALAAAKKVRKAGGLVDREAAQRFLEAAEAIEATHAGADLKTLMKRLIEHTIANPGLSFEVPEPKTPSRGYEPKTLDEAKRISQQHIHQGGQPEPAGAKWYQVWKRDWWDTAYKNAIDQGHYLKLLVDQFGGGEERPGAEDPYVRFRNAAGASRQADYLLNYGTFNINSLKDTGAGLLELLGPWSTRLNDVRDYVSNLHALELVERVARARKEAGELNTGPQVGDRVAWVEEHIDAIGDIVGIKDGYAKVRWIKDGKPIKVDIPLEDAKQRLIATVGGKEVRNIVTGFNLNGAKMIVDAAPPELRAVGKAIVEFNERVTDDFLVESGLVSAKTAAEWKKINPANVPFFRLMETASEGSSLFSRHGSLKQVIDPIESIIRNVHAFSKRANVNIATLKLVDLVRADAAGREIFKLVKEPLVETTVPLEEMAAYLERVGSKVEPEELSFLRPDKVTLEENQIQVWRDGKREIYQVDEKYQPVVEAIRNLAPDDLPMAMGWLREAAGLLRSGATMTLEFLTTNVIRDQPSTYLNSKNGYIPFLSAVDGLVSIFSKDEAFRSYIKSGAGMSTIAELDRNYIEKNVFDLSRKTGFLSSARNVLRNVRDTASAVLEANEMMTRVGEFKAAVANGKDPFRAGFEARDLLDFSRSGAKTKAVSQIVAFFNANLQGLDKFGRSLKDDPVKFALKATPLAIATGLLWWANKDDPRYRQTPDWQRDLFWIVPTDSWEDSDETTAADFPEHLRRQVKGRWQVNTGVTYRIPKPFEAGVLCFTLTERLIDKYFAKNPKAFDGFAKTVAGVTLPNVMPTALVPLLEQYSNRRWMSGTKLIPAYLEDRSHDLQYTEYTTETAKKLASILPEMPLDAVERSVRSPILVENWVRGILGPLGMQAMQLIDQIGQANGYYNAPQKPEKTWADTPFWRAFTVRYPSASAQPVADFHERYRKFTQVTGDVAHLKNTGQLEEMDRRIEAAGDRYGVTLNEITRALAMYQQQAHVIAFDREMTPQEKRQALDGVYYAIIEIAQTGNDMLDEIEGQEGTAR